MKNKALLLLILGLLGTNAFVQADTVRIYPEVQPRSFGVENYAMNVFCTEIVHETDLKAIAGSGVFLTNPNDGQSLVLTSAHVARHLLDNNKTCVGRTGNFAQTTHTLTLRYIPRQWLKNNIGFIIGDLNKDSIGEFDFALVEAKRIVPKKIQSIYDIFTPRLYFSFGDYESRKGHIFTYPAEETLSKDIYNPLYLKKDSMNIAKEYTAPTLKDTEGLADIAGTESVDHGSSGGMVIDQGVSNKLLGIVASIIDPSKPQTIRIVTMGHILSVLEYELETTLPRSQDIFTDPKGVRKYLPQLQEIMDDTLKDIGLK